MRSQSGPQESSSLEKVGLWVFYKMPDYINLLFKTILSTNKSSPAMVFLQCPEELVGGTITFFCILKVKWVGRALTASICACSNSKSSFKHFGCKAGGEIENKTYAKTAQCGHVSILRTKSHPVGVCGRNQTVGRRQRSLLWYRQEGLACYRGS